MTVKNTSILVAGATGGVGQITVAKLLEKKDFQVRVLTRNREKAVKMFDNRVEIAIGDICNPNTLTQATKDINYIICCTGTSAFPSAKWDFDIDNNPLEWLRIYFDANFRNSRSKNSPQKVDAEGVINLVNAAPPDLKRFIFVSSCGVLRKNMPPYNILNAFGVLDAKKQGEEAIINSGLPYTIIRPSRLIDGPYTSYDLNTLLKATTNNKLDVILGTGDTLNGQTSRIDVAEACVQSLFYPTTSGKIFEIVNFGSRPSQIDWEKLFLSLS